MFVSVPDTFAQATVHGWVRDMTGQPISGATVRLVTLNQTRVTSDSGYYDFAQATVIHPFDSRSGQGFRLSSKAGKLYLGVDMQEVASVSFYDLSGKLLKALDVRSYLPGNNVIDVPFTGENKTVIAKVTSKEASSCFKFTVVGRDIAGLVTMTSSSPLANGILGAAKPAAADSICVTHDHYCGGLDFINTRKISADTGLNNFRMFSSDTAAAGDTVAAHGWYSSKMNFTFQSGDAGGTYYQTKVPDYVWEEQETQREVEQSFYRLPSEVPKSMKYATYNCIVTPQSGVANTGGNTLNFSSTYANGQPWWEILGVQHHEMSHSYQQYYSTTGASGFGEAIPDAVRCLTGFFYWPKGNKCSGGFAGAYQTGGKYWYYIELKHPGFLYKVMSSANTGDISTRVQTITGESLATMCTECEQTGMPYTLGRGSF